MNTQTEVDNPRIALIRRFGILPEININDPNTEHTVFSFEQALYWGKEKKLSTTKAWTLDGEDIIPKKINNLSSRSLAHCGTGTNPQEAYENAFQRMHTRRIKRNADFIWPHSGILMKNGNIYYYFLNATVHKIK